MSQENVEVAHRLIDAFNRRDLDAFLALVDREVEYRVLMVEVEGTFHGHDDMRKMWEEILAVAPDLAMEIEETRDQGNFVIGAIRYRFHGRGSGVPLEGTFWAVGEYRDQKLIADRHYGSEAEAIEAAGLRE